MRQSKRKQAVCRLADILRAGIISRLLLRPGIISRQRHITPAIIKLFQIRLLRNKLVSDNPLMRTHAYCRMCPINL